MNPASGTPGLEGDGEQGRAQEGPRAGRGREARLKAAAGGYFYPLPTPPLTAAAPGSVTRSWAGARPGEAPAAAEIKAPLPKNTGPARRGLSVPGVVPKEPGEGRLGSVRTFGDIFLLKMGTRCWRVWPEAPLREAQEGERQSRQPSARAGRKLQLPPPALRLEGDRVPRVALFDHGDPPGLSFVLSGARGGLGTGVFKGLFFPWTSEPPSPAGLTSGRHLAPAPGAAARAVYGHTALFSLVFFFYDFGFCSRVFHALKARGSGRSRLPVMLRMLLSGTRS